MKKIIILGAQGMLGQALVKVFSQKNYLLKAWDKDNLDIQNYPLVKSRLKKEKPDIVINATGYTNVDGAEKEKSLALDVNGNAVGNLARVAKEIKALFIHFSTDYVFGQEKKEGYTEKDVPQNPLNIYGESKLLGEQLLLKENPCFYLIRTSWLFGPGGNNFVKTMLNLAKEKKVLRVIDDQWGKPTYAPDLAKQVEKMIEIGSDSGIYHFTNEPALTWYQSAKTIFNIRKKIFSDSKIPELIRIKTKDFHSLAKRPHFSVLLNTKLPLGRSVDETMENYIRKEE